MEAILGDGRATLAPVPTRAVEPLDAGFPEADCACNGPRGTDEGPCLAVAVGVSPPAGVLDALCAGARGVAPREAWPFWRALLRRGARAARARAISRGARSA